MQRKKYRYSPKTILRYAFPVILLIIIWLTQLLPGWGEAYARSIYPYISIVLSSISNLFPFSVGDLFITLSIAGLILHPIYTRLKRRKPWKLILLHSAEYLAWVYIWFYLAWGLNYSQHNFYQRTTIPYSAYNSEVFKEFVTEYVDSLNNNYTEITWLNKDRIHEDIILRYRQISETMGIRSPKGFPRVKTMLFTSFISKMGILGYMGPFFCEFNVNGDLLPSQYASTYAHELSHLLGITNEAEANFYAYQVCARSEDKAIRFCGYFSVLNHVMGNARQFLSEEEFKELVSGIRPEIIELSSSNREYWMAKYSQTIGDMQSRIYDLYLKGNKISSGRKNYSEVVGLLVSWRKYNKKTIIP